MQESNSIADDLDLVVSGLSSVRVVIVLVLAVSVSFVVLSLFLVSSDLSIASLSSGGVDSLGEGIDLGVKGIDLSNQDGNLIVQLVSDIVVLLDEVVVVSSLDLSGFGNLSNELVAKINNSLDEGLVSLNWGSSSDLGE